MEKYIRNWSSLVLSLLSLSSLSALRSLPSALLRWKTLPLKRKSPPAPCLRCSWRNRRSKGEKPG